MIHTLRLLERYIRELEDRMEQRTAIIRHSERAIEALRKEQEEDQEDIVLIRAEYEQMKATMST